MKGLDKFLHLCNFCLHRKFSFYTSVAQWKGTRFSHNLSASLNPVACQSKLWPENFIVNLLDTTWWWYTKHLGVWVQILSFTKLSNFRHRFLLDTRILNQKNHNKLKLQGEQFKCPFWNTWRWKYFRLLQSIKKGLGLSYNPIN